MTDIYPKDFSSTAASNSTVGGINIAEGMTAAQLNDALRAICAVFALPDFGDGTGFKTDAIAESTAAAGVTIDGLLIKDGALPNLTLGDTVEVGTMRETFKATADTGWLMMNGNTLGSAASAATQSSDDYETLFAFLWDNVSDTYAAVSSGRGASAAADWAANKTIVIPNRADRAPFGAGSTYAAGETFGVAAVTLTAAQSGVPAHKHIERGSPNTDSTAHISRRADGGGFGNSSSTTADNTPQDAAESHTNIPPGIGVYYQIKY